MTSILIPNKNPPPRWNLSVKFWPLLTRDCEVVFFDQIPNHLYLLQNNLVCCHVTYDDRSIFQQPVHSQMELAVEIDDDRSTTDHSISVWMSGKTDWHSPIHDGHEISLCLACRIAVEHVDVTNLVTGGGLIVIGENSMASVLQIRTPVYRWLLDNFSVLYKPYMADPVRQIVEKQYGTLT